MHYYRIKGVNYRIKGVNSVINFWHRVNYRIKGVNYRIIALNSVINPHKEIKRKERNKEEVIRRKRRQRRRQKFGEENLHKKTGNETSSMPENV
jgi:hypothetical protein